MYVCQFAVRQLVPKLGLHYPISVTCQLLCYAQSCGPTKERHYATVLAEGLQTSGADVIIILKRVVR